MVSDAERIIILETKLDTIAEKLVDVKAHISNLPTKDDLSKVIMEHSYKCSLRDVMVTRDDFGKLASDWYTNYRKTNIENINMKTTLLKNVWWIATTIAQIACAFAVWQAYK